MKNGKSEPQTYQLRHQPSRSQPRTSSRASLPCEAWSPTLGAWIAQGQTHFRVWAPERKTVEVILERSGENIKPYSLTRQSDGTFSGIYPEAVPGDLYRYRLDSKNTYPDPASRFQPHGVHGPSQITDATSFAWTDAAWSGVPLSELVIYELHVGTFTPDGTYEAVIERLPELKELGITAIELMPLGDFAGLRNWGYDGVAIYAPARCYGSPDDLRRLVNEAHRIGLTVILDVVYNHLGPDGNYTGVYSPYYVTDRHSSFWGKGLNFDAEHHKAVRTFFIENALHWIHEYHFDGLRLDATHAILDSSPQHILAEIRERIQESAKNRSIHLIAEDNRNEVSLLKPESERGLGLSGVWSDDFHHQVRRILAGDSDGYYMDYSTKLDELAQTAQHGWFYTGQISSFTKTHRGTDPAGIPPEHFVFCIQNHDQVGNRALGDRIHHQISLDAYRVASALLLSLPQTPLIFMGQEWAASTPFLYFTDHDEELGKAVTEGRKKEFESFKTFSSGVTIPDPQSPATFRKSKLIWSERMQEPHESVWLFYRALLNLRREEFGVISDSKSFVVAALNQSALLVKRPSKDGHMILGVFQMTGKGTVDLASHPSLKSSQSIWNVLLTSEEKTFCPSSSKPPIVHLSGEAPVIEFERPGAVFLKNHPASIHHE